MNERHMKIMVPYEEPTDTCPDCSEHPCDCGMPAGYQSDIRFACNFAPHIKVIEASKVAEIIEQRNEWGTVSKDGGRYCSHQRRERWIKAVPSKVSAEIERELATVTEQRDRLDDQLDEILLRLGRTQERMFDAERQRDRLTKAIEPLKYWRDISECDCSNLLPQGGCLRCDLDKILNPTQPTKP